MTKPCAECGQEFEFKTHNQKYCSGECCRVATNKRIMQKYYEKKERLSGKERICSTCNSILSRYNDADTCVICDMKSTKNKTTVAIKEIENVIGGIKESKSKKGSRN